MCTKTNKEERAFRIRRSRIQIMFYASEGLNTWTQHTHEAHQDAVAVAPTAVKSSRSDAKTQWKLFGHAE